MSKYCGPFHYGLMMFVVFVLSGCSSAPVKTGADYSDSGRGGLYELRDWALDGRISLRASNESWSASIEWQRRDDDETIRLIGPLGQGAVFIHIADEYVDVDRGDGAARYLDRSDDFITEQLGFYVPLRSLRYWVVGLIDPGSPSEDVVNGFIQDGWRVLYREMQQTGRGVLPYKIDVSNQEVKLKLIIDQWNMHD